MLDNKIYNILAAKMREQIVRINLTSSNIANIDTPGYKAKRIADADSKFGNDLMLEITSSRHIQPSSGQTYDIIKSNDIARNDGNNVNMEKEMVNIARAKEKYAQISSILRFKLHSIDALLDQLGRV
ncbi:MAG: flagellar basal-body rod protein FlgB [bacterium]|nr:MAG: flagellar basal-body rod protein FlgB [bacterium]